MKYEEILITCFVTYPSAVGCLDDVVLVRAKRVAIRVAKLHGHLKHKARLTFWAPIGEVRDPRRPTENLPKQLFFMHAFHQRTADDSYKHPLLVPWIPSEHFVLYPALPVYFNERMRVSSNVRGAKK